MTPLNRPEPPHGCLLRTACPAMTGRSSGRRWVQSWHLPTTPLSLCQQPTPAFQPSASRSLVAWPRAVFLLSGSQFPVCQKWGVARWSLHSPSWRRSSCWVWRLAATHGLGSRAGSVVGPRLLQQRWTSRHSSPDLAEGPPRSHLTPISPGMTCTLWLLLLLMELNVKMLKASN